MDDGSSPDALRGLDDAVQPAPTTVGGILRRIGPGLITAGSIVGSGELIATTKTGAEAGFWLLWLILIGCVIKVFVQVEFGRFAIVNGQSTMDALNSVPGPVVQVEWSGRPHARRMRANWIVWYWFLMWIASIGQLGGIVGGVGQALAISAPLTDAGRRFNEYVDHKTKLRVRQAELNNMRQSRVDDTPHDAVTEQNMLAAVARHERWIAEAERQFRTRYGQAQPPAPVDDRLWAAIVAVATAILLVAGRYGLIQNFSTFMVAGFTLLTIVNLMLLQANPSWAVTAADVIQGMRFRLPPHSPTAISTALFTFGIIGVGAAEIVAYPYWCIEKGYARFTGPRAASADWGPRAQGWMRVMRWDAWCSMVLYTFATLAFYLLGAAILGRTGLDPEKEEMIRTLAVMYEPVFQGAASLLFLVGAFAVLYSTFFVANAAHARVFSDSLGVLGAASSAERAHRRRVVLFSGLFPLLCLAMYVFFPRPAQLVLISGLMQAVMLPMLAVAGLYFRYRRNDPRLRPGKLWDLFLWISAAGMSIAGVWALISKFQ